MYLIQLQTSIITQVHKFGIVQHLLGKSLGMALKFDAPAIEQKFARIQY